MERFTSSADSLPFHFQNCDETTLLFPVLIEYDRSAHIKEHQRALHWARQGRRRSKSAASCVYCPGFSHNLPSTFPYSSGSLTLARTTPS